MPDSLSRLRKNTLYLYTATIIKLIGPLITLPYLTRILSVDSYGYVSFVKSYAIYMQLLLDFGFLLSATKDIALIGADLKKVGRIVGDTLLEKIILAIVGAAATIVLCSLMPLLGGNLLFTWLYFFSCVATISILDFLYRGLQKMEYVAIPLIIAKVMVVVLTIAFVKNDGDLLLIPAFELLGNACAGIVSFAFLCKVGVKPVCSSASTWLKDLKESGVYFLSNFATSFFGALTTFVVGVYLEVSQVAFWGICMTGVSAAKAIYAPLGNSIYPHMVESKDIALVNRLARKGIVPLAIMCAIVVCFSDQIMSLVGGDAYAAAGDVLVLLLPVMVFSFYSMLYGWPVLGVLGDPKDVTYTTIAAALVQAGSIFFLIVIGHLDLVTLAVCCALSEFFLLASRGLILWWEIRRMQ